MTANRIVSVVGTDSGLGAWNGSASWTTVTGLTATGVTVQGTGSVCIIMATVPLEEGNDLGFDIRISVNGSATGSPLAQSFTDSTGAGETTSAQLVWAVDGLSGSSNSFTVEGINRQGSASAHQTLERSLQVLEIENGASIIHDDGAITSDAGTAPTTEATMLDMEGTGISVAGTDSILLMLATIPRASEGDSRSVFRFAVDNTPVSVYSMMAGDSDTGGSEDWCGGALMHAETGVSAGTHSFQVRWVNDAADGGTCPVTGDPRIFQVIEITSDAELLVDISGADSWSVSGTQNDQSRLDTSISPSTDPTTAANAVHLIFANGIMNPTAGDDCAAFRIGVDDVEQGGAATSWSDEVAAVSYGWGGLTYVETGLSAAAHSFQVIGENLQGSPAMDTTFARSLQVIEFTETAVASPLPIIGESQNTLLRM